jgi:hypothetical protein
MLQSTNMRFRSVLSDVTNTAKIGLVSETECKQFCRETVTNEDGNDRLHTFQ